jgi:hypothetical protein
VRVARPRLEAEPLRQGIALIALATIVALALGLALIVASRSTALSPTLEKGGAPGWLAWPWHDIAPAVRLHRWDLAGLFTSLVMAMGVCYLIVLRFARSLPKGPALVAIGLVHAVMLLSPPFALTDIFNYIDFARLGVVHGLNPYTHFAAVRPHDPSFHLATWHHLPTPYGPLFTVFTYALVPLGVHAGYWALKALTMLASLTCLWLVWRCAVELRKPPLPVVLLVWLNPLVIVYGLGGFHNDFFWLLPMLVAVLLVLRGRDAAAGALAAATPFIKLAAGAAAPFVLLGARRRLVALGAAIATSAVLLAAAVAEFGTRYPGMHDQMSVVVGPYSVPTDIASIFGETIGPGVRDVTAAVLVGVIVMLLVRTWRGADWLVSAGWAAAALALSQFEPMPWYVVWSLPFAALGSSRALRVGVLVLTVVLFVHATPQQSLILTHDLGLHGTPLEAGRATRALLH